LARAEQAGSGLFKSTTYPIEVCILKQLPISAVLIYCVPVGLLFVSIDGGQVFPRDTDANVLFATITLELASIYNTLQLYPSLSAKRIFETNFLVIFSRPNSIALGMCVYSYSR
jgi:hypothetical protein